MRKLPPSYESEAARLTVFVFRGRLWQTERTTGLSVGAALAVPQCVVEHGEELEPPLDARIVVPRFSDDFQRLIIRPNCAPRVTSKVLDGPDNAARFQVERGPVPIRIEGRTADLRDGLHLVV